MKRFKWDFQGHRFTTTKGSSFYQKKVKASLFSTHYVSIYHNLPRCRPGWSCFCGLDGFANPKCLHLSFHRPMNQNYKQRYLDFLVISIFACRPNQIASYKCTAFSNILSPVRLPLVNIFLFMCFCGQELCFFGKLVKRKFLG